VGWDDDWIYRIIEFEQLQLFKSGNAPGLAAVMPAVLNSSEIGQTLERLAREIVAAGPAGNGIALIGIRSRGEILAQRLQHILRKNGLANVDMGALDITLYRDDLNQMGSSQPTVRTTEIDFSIDDRLIVLVDDVLNTGRSVRSALDALVDLGRPLAIRLAVLIDRGSRELPISADYVGKVIKVPINKRVQVYLHEVDNREEVVIE
jgi:pyrimidine operon attenuation protein/uracil phosphoribosyltransferase